MDNNWVNSVLTVYLKSDISSDKLLIDVTKFRNYRTVSPLESVACLYGNNNKVKNFYILHEIDCSSTEVRQL